MYVCVLHVCYVCVLHRYNILCQSNVSVWPYNTLICTVFFLPLNEVMSKVLFVCCCNNRVAMEVTDIT